ncbi:hypothetical protein ISCGN_025985 [Ixodes scapularis]
MDHYARSREVVEESVSYNFGVNGAHFFFVVSFGVTDVSSRASSEIVFEHESNAVPIDAHINPAHRNCGKPAAGNLKLPTGPKGALASVLPGRPMTTAPKPGPPVATGPPPQPDLSHLTEEERRIIESVMARQKEEEDREKEILRRRRDNTICPVENYCYRSIWTAHAGLPGIAFSCVGAAGCDRRVPAAYPPANKAGRGARAPALNSASLRRSISHRPRKMGNPSLRRLQTLGRRSRQTSGTRYSFLRTCCSSGLYFEEWRRTYSTFLEETPVVVCPQSGKGNNSLSVPPQKEQKHNGRGR